MAGNKIKSGICSRIFQYRRPAKTSGAMESVQLNYLSELRLKDFRMIGLRERIEVHYDFKIFQLS